MNIFVLEDNEHRIEKFKRELIGHNVDYATTAFEGIAFVSKKDYDLIFLDHDLGGLEMVDSNKKEGTGYHVALEINFGRNSENPCIIHSCNPHGSEMMKKALGNSKIVPFVNLDIQKEVALVEGSKNE